MELTQKEWSKGIEFLTRTSHITDDERQEFILIADVLGISMLAVGINHGHVEGATESGDAVEVVGRHDGNWTAIEVAEALRYVQPDVFGRSWRCLSGG